MKLFHSKKVNGWKHTLVLNQKRNRAKNDFEKNFFKFLVNAAFGKFLENVRYRLRLEIIKKYDTNNIIKQQSKLTFNGIHNSYENYYSYTLKKTKYLWMKLYMLVLLY